MVEHLGDRRWPRCGRSMVEVVAILNVSLMFYQIADLRKSTHSGNREFVPIVHLSLLDSQFIQRMTDCLEQVYVVFSFLIRLGVLPIDVDPIQTVVFDELDTGSRKGGTVGRCRSCLCEVGRVSLASRIEGAQACKSSVSVFPRDVVRDARASRFRKSGCDDDLPSLPRRAGP